MTFPELKRRIRAGEIDTVLTAFPDPFGRLVGKRVCADHFLEHVARHGTHGCNYLLTVYLEMDPLDGFAVANWAAGFGDFAFRPDLRTLRALPWQPGAALVLCDWARDDGTLVAEAPRSVLRTQVERLRRLGYTCRCATELEFYLFNQTYHAAFASGYRELQPASDYRIDYHLMQPTRDEPLLRAIRNGMTAAACRSRAARANGAAASTRSTSARPSRSKWPTGTWSSNTASRNWPSSMGRPFPSWPSWPPARPAIPATST